MYPATKMLPTRAGNIACWDTEKDAPALFFVHGNSASKEVFAQQFENPLLQEYRLVAIDLPGHGQSDNVTNLEEICSISSFARLMDEIIHMLNLKKTTLIGWSMGGHVGIEMLGQGIELAGLVITGTPPCGPGADDMAAAFLPSPHMALTGKVEFTAEEVQNYTNELYNGTGTEQFADMVKRTQGAVRATVVGNFVVPDSSHDQKQVVATTNVPLGVLQGEKDSFMSLDYFDGLKWNSLWQDKVSVIRGAGHAPFWEKPEEYDKLLLNFLKEQA